MNINACSNIPIVTKVNTVYVKILHVDVELELDNQYLISFVTWQHWVQILPALDLDPNYQHSLLT